MCRCHTYQSHGMKVNGKTSHGSIERDGSGYDGVTLMQSGVIAAVEKMSRVALSNNNTTNENLCEVTATRHFDFILWEDINN